MKIQAQIMLFVIIFKTMLTDDSLSPWILINIVKNIIQSSLKIQVQIMLFAIILRIKTAKNDSKCLVTILSQQRFNNKNWVICF